jgi:signal transduction histidine kinase
MDRGEARLSGDADFARLVSLACHDLRTPLATVHGFARTLANGGQLEPPNDRYVEMIEAASAQLAELLDELSLAARIADGRYDPVLRAADTLELAQAAAARLGADRV